MKSTERHPLFHIPGEGEFPIFNLRAHTFTCCRVGQGVLDVCEEGGSGRSWTINDGASTHDGKTYGHDIEAVILFHNRAHNHGNVERIKETEGVLPTVIPLEHQ